MAPRVAVDREAVAAFCRRHAIRELGLFGSALRDDFRPDSDVDVLYDFQPGTSVLSRSSMQKDDIVYAGHMLDVARKAVERGRTGTRAKGPEVR